ncbi:hypothetical protein DL96DRAFT_1702372 [Flagelloscypha sp. PMI_526]|nr:hypothetical protein DL96DRAFT_1702372 [Flagelloscypha sp. PMI_526]
MLKRQRPVTPPPAFTIDAPLHPDLEFPSPKRRRVQPPSLDGPSRDCYGHPQLQHDSADDDEEYFSDSPQPMSRDENQTAASSSVLTQYKTTNEMLHELHTLSQHRLAFASSHAPPPQCFNDTISTPSIQSKIGVTLISHDGSVPQRADKLAHSHGAEALKQDYHEEDVVRQNYQEANRLLRSLFLSRRKNLEEMG